MFGFDALKQRLPRDGEALPGRNEPVPLSNRHVVHGRPLRGDFTGLASVQFGMGCFWGAERKFWSIPGVHTTAVGYAGGATPNASYEEVCSGQTGHAEAVKVVHDPAKVSFEKLLRVFWESHDPTQGMAQGNDRGTQYRSAIHCESQAQYDIAIASRDAYQRELTAAGLGAITTQIVYPAPAFYYAEEPHQQYLARNPNGYCGLGGTGVSCPIGVEA